MTLEAAGELRVLVFEDTHPINGLPDLPQERALAGFRVRLTPVGGEQPGERLAETGAHGTVVMAALAPGRYRLEVLPPAGGWQLTSATAEASGDGQATEASFGFVRAFHDGSVLSGGPGLGSALLSGHGVSRAPDGPARVEPAALGPPPAVRCWVGLNEFGGRGVHAGPCSEEGRFAIPDVPPGLWQLVLWDTASGGVAASGHVEVPARGGTVSLGELVLAPPGEGHSPRDGGPPRTPPPPFAAECEPEEGAPVIHSVSSNYGRGGPYVPAAGGKLTILAAAREGRDHGFGARPGRVSLAGKALPIEHWSEERIVAAVPAAAKTGQLLVTRAEGGTSAMGVTVTVGGPAPRHVAAGESIQAAIDAARPGELILVAPGAYAGGLVVRERLRLQGYGAPATRIVAGPQGAGILVAPRGGFGRAPHARIDGFTISHAQGGGIAASAHAERLEIANNRIGHNTGLHGGGIAVGDPLATDPAREPGADPRHGGYADARNTDIAIHHNHIASNAGRAGGGGIALATGSHRYRVEDNVVCGNFTGGGGAGIAHLGRSDDGLIARNRVRFNQALDRGRDGHGGGLLIAGRPPLPGSALSPGSGSVTVEANLIEGNLAEAGDGGGIGAEFVNGLDVARHPDRSAAWFELRIHNNMVVNNAAGLAGGGIALKDVARSRIVNNTVARNDSTATARAAFAAGRAGHSVPQPAGIAARAHTGSLERAIGLGAAASLRQGYANPVLANNIVWQNRAFYWRRDDSALPARAGLVPEVHLGASPVFWDLAVLGVERPGARAPMLAPRHSILTDRTGYGASNHSVDPQFVAAWYNMDGIGGTGRARGDYHLQRGSPARYKGEPAAAPGRDFDGEPRALPRGSKPDIGADERR